jgi:hypothetical protein
VRKLSGTLEQNPMLQVIVIGGLILLFGLLLYMRVLNQSTGATTPSPSESAPAVTPAPSADTADSAAPPASQEGTAGSAAPSQDGPEAPSTPATPPESVPGAPSAFETMTPGPGLPADVSRAYKADKVVVLSIHQLGGVPERISLDTLRRLQRSLGVDHNIAIFTFNVSRISRYARITQGVNVNRVPALVVIKPFSLSPDGVPQATVRYGYMGEQNAAQAVIDAAYSGPTLPYYAE